MKSIKKKGFTLVELLVTIALLGILGSIIAINMTSIYKKSQAQEKTRIESIIKSSCEAYLKIESKESIDGCLTTNKLIEADYLKKSSLPKDYLNSSVSIKDNQCTKVSLTNDSCKEDNIQDKKYYVYFYNGSQKLENLTKSGKYNNSIIDIFSLIFLLFLINTSIAAPDDVNSPPINEPNDIELFRYNSVSITLAEQFGISPIRLVINGPNIVFVKNIFVR